MVFQLTVKHILYQNRLERKAILIFFWDAIDLQDMFAILFEKEM